MTKHRLGAVSKVVLYLFAIMILPLRVAYAAAPPSASPPLPHLDLPNPQIHTAPGPNSVIVQLETWLWIDDAIWHQYPNDIDAPVATPVPTASPAGNGAVKLTATPNRVVWDMDDGNVITCYGPGKSYNAAIPYYSQSPSCSYRYLRSSTWRPHDQYTVRATVYWQVTAHAPSGASQSLPETTTTSTAKLRVGEIDALNLGVPYDEVMDAINSQVQGGDVDLSDLYVKPGSDGGVNVGNTPDPPKDHRGGVLGAIDHVGGAFKSVGGAFKSVGGAVYNCFDGWGATCTKWGGVAVAAVGTGVLCAVTVGAGCVAAAIIVGSTAQGALFCSDGSIGRCAAEGFAWGVVGLVGAGVVARLGRFAAPFLGEFAAPLTSRLAGLIPEGLQTASRGAGQFLERRLFTPLSEGITQPISEWLAATRAQVWERFPTLGRLASRFSRPALSELESSLPKLQQLAETRARALQEALPTGSQGRVTMAVGIGQDSQGVLRTVVGTSEPNGYLRPGVVLNPGELLAPGPALSHAEQDIINFMRMNKINPLTIGAGRPICPPCADAITKVGASPASVLKELIRP